MTRSWATATGIDRPPTARTSARRRAASSNGSHARLNSIGVWLGSSQQPNLPLASEGDDIRDPRHDVVS
jgi:hypothetical protein